MTTTFEQVYRVNFEKVLTHIEIKTKDKFLAQDLTSDTFIKAYKNFNKYDAEKSGIATWLMMIANGVIIDNFRTDRFNKKVTLVGDFVNDNGKDSFEFVSIETTDKEIESEVLSSKINKAIHNLKPKYRKVAILFFIGEKKIKEIAETLDMPINTVKVTIHRVRAMLQKSLTLA